MSQNSKERTSSSREDPREVSTIPKIKGDAGFKEVIHWIDGLVRNGSNVVVNDDKNDSGDDLHRPGETPMSLTNMSLYMKNKVKIAQNIFIWYLQTFLLSKNPKLPN